MSSEPQKNDSDKVRESFSSDEETRLGTDVSTSERLANVEDETRVVGSSVLAQRADDSPARPAKDSNVGKEREDSETLSTTKLAPYALSWGEFSYESGFDRPLPDQENDGEFAQDEKTVISKNPSENDEPESDDVGLLKPGSKFGQFTIVRYVGGGGMGRVYEGEDRDLERKVAIKVLPKRRAQDDGVVARFLNEAKSAARLNHENIAQVYLYGNVEGLPYIAFEYVEGVNLRDYIRENGALELGEAVEYVLQTAAALAHAASHGVTHRDVKPSNIIVTPQKRVKLIDMGLARLLKPQLDDDLTESGVTLGTFDYISPEQARDPRLADVRSDVYSLGCTFFFMLTASPPYPEGTMLQKLLQHQGDEAPDVRGENPNIPAEIATVIKKMMKKNPDERYQTPDALIADLLEISEMIGLRVSARGYVESVPTETQPQKSKLWKAPGIYAALIFVILISSYSLFSDNRELTLPDVKPFESSVHAPSELNSSQDVALSNGSDSERSSVSGKLLNGSQENSSTSDLSQTGSSRADSGVLLTSRELDELYVSSGARIVDNLLVENSGEREGWRDSYLHVEANAFETTRVAMGWRSDGAPTGQESVVVSTLPESELPLDETSQSFCCYSLLGVKAENETTNALVPTPSRVVDGIGKDPNTFSSLQSALADASSRDTKFGGSSNDEKSTLRIELKFNEIVSTPSLSISDMKVEIFASPGYSPILSFQPPESTSGAFGESMFRLERSELTLRGATIRFTVPSQDSVTSEEWSIFDGIGGSRLSLVDCELTLRNMIGDSFTTPMHTNVAMFRASRDPFDKKTLDSFAESFSVRLDNVLACGESNLLIAESAFSSLEARNSCFNISGAAAYFVDNMFLRRSATAEETEESRDDVFLNSSVASEKESRFKLSLDQSVLIGRSCLIRVDAEDSDAQPPFAASLTNSIVRLNDQALALVVSSGSLDEASFLDQWKFDSLLVLDVSAFYRRRFDRAEPYREFPFTFETGILERMKLNDLATDGGSRLESIPPHRFSRYDFNSYLLQPIIESSSASNEVKSVVESIKKGLWHSFFEETL